MMNYQTLRTWSTGIGQPIGTPILILTNQEGSQISFVISPQAAAQMGQALIDAAAKCMPATRPN